MKETKIIHVPRKGDDFHEAEEMIKKICEDGWKLISVSVDSTNALKLIATFQR